MLNKYMKGVKVLMTREREKRKKMICGIGKEKKKKGKKVKRPENIE